MLNGLNQVKGFKSLNGVNNVNLQNENEAGMKLKL